MYLRGLLAMLFCLSFWARADQAQLSHLSVPELEERLAAQINAKSVRVTELEFNRVQTFVGFPLKASIYSLWHLDHVVSEPYFYKLKFNVDARSGATFEYHCTLRRYDGRHVGVGEVDQAERYVILKQECKIGSARGVVDDDMLSAEQLSRGVPDKYGELYLFRFNPS